MSEPTNNRALIPRCKALVAGLRAGESLPTIARRLEVCSRTLHRDVEFLRDHFYLDATYDGRLKRWTVDPDWEFSFDYVPKRLRGGLRRALNSTC
jgi:hypothetical protein